MAASIPQIIEQDGNIVRIVAGDIEVIAEMVRGPDELVFDRLSIDGAGPGSVGLAQLRALARQFAVSQGVSKLRVRGTTRTTGANPGKVPREIVVRV
jgi:filamentous hemagglutinin